MSCPRPERLVVVGNGMAGVALVEQVLKHGRPAGITIFGDETHVNYNRILLSSVLAGEKEFDDIVLNEIEWYRRNGIRAKLGERLARFASARTPCQMQSWRTFFPSYHPSNSNTPPN